MVVMFVVCVCRVDYKVPQHSCGSYTQVHPPLPSFECRPNPLAAWAGCQEHHRDFRSTRGLTVYIYIVAYYTQIIFPLKSKIPFVIFSLYFVRGNACS